MATRRGIPRRLIGGRFGAINRDGAARTLRAQKQLTWPAAPVRSTRQQRFAHAPDEASNPPLNAGLFRVSFGAVFGGTRLRPVESSLESAFRTILGNCFGNDFPFGRLRTQGDKRPPSFHFVQTVCEMLIHTQWAFADDLR
jgi:hypothetical protein